MTVFYKVDTSNVQKHNGDFGSAFEKTCEMKTEEEKKRWRKALTYVANIAGEHSLNWYVVYLLSFLYNATMVVSL